MDSKELPLEKTTDINREHVEFELLADESTILEAGFSDAEISRIFNAAAGVF